MKKQNTVWVSVLTLGLFASYAWGAGHHEHGVKEVASHQHSHGNAASGQARKTANVSRTIKINALDTMLFELKDAEAKADKTIRFVVTNLGKIRHELAIGTREEQLQHAKMMVAA